MYVCMYKISLIKVFIVSNLQRFGALPLYQEYKLQGEEPLFILKKFLQLTFYKKKIKIIDRTDFNDPYA